MSSKSPSVAVPEIPSGLIVLKVDPLSRNVKLDQEPLQVALRKIREYVRELNAKSLQGLQDELTEGLMAAKREVDVVVGEKVAELELSMGARFHEAEDASKAATTNVEALTLKVNSLAEKVNIAVQQAEQANERVAVEVRRVFDAFGTQDSPSFDSLDSCSPSPPPDIVIAAESEAYLEHERGGVASMSKQSSAASIHKQSSNNAPVPNILLQGSVEEFQMAPLAMDSAGGAMRLGASPTHRMDRATSKGEGGEGAKDVLSPPERLSDRSERRSSRRVDTRQSVLRHTDATRFASFDDVASIKATMQKLSEDSAECLRVVAELDTRLTSRETEAGTSVEKQRQGHLELTQRCEKLSQEAAVAQASLAEHGPSINALQLAVRELREQKAEVMALNGARTELHDAVDRIRRALTPMDVRATQLEAAASHAKQGLIEAAQRSDSMQEQQSDLKLLLEKKIQDTAAANTRTESNLHEKSLDLTAQNRSLGEQLNAVQTEISHLYTVAGLVPGKAEQSEVRALQNTLGQLAEGIKDKEQAVLFGARCLSCNLVFDDVQQNAGVVNNRSEKQKAQLFAEVQRAFHTAHADPNKSIKMIAVKVGRPGQIQGAAGNFEGRDSASPAFGIEDVQLVPTKRPLSQEKAGTPRRFGATSETPRLVPTPPSSERARLPTRTRASPADFVGGPMDYRHPLSKLVGRSEDSAVN